jgi:hypothetical protein
LFENALAQPVWMQVVVKPSVAFSLDPRRLAQKNDFFMRLLQLNDRPVLFDGKTPKAGQEDLKADDFTSPAFPWSKVLRMPVEYQVG